MGEKKPITVRVEEETYQKIQERKKEDQSDSAATREVINEAFNLDSERQQLQERIEQLQSELEAKESRIEELQNELMATNKRIDANTEIVEYAEKEKNVVEKREIKQDLKDYSPIYKRIKWKLFGMPKDLVEEKANNSERE